MTQPTIAQLRNLTDRAAHGLTADEQQRLRDGIDHLHDRLATAEQEADDSIAAASRLVGLVGKRAERAEGALAEARRLHAQTCPHAQGAARPPAFTCSLCTALTAPARETT